MKTLLVVRHGKAEHGAGRSDRDRRLTGRGEGDALMVGLMLVDAGLVPDRVLTSPAVRALATAEHLVRAGGFSVKPTIDERLYESSWQRCLEAIREQPDHLGTLLVAGHNPTLEGVVNELCGICRCRLPTAAAVCLDLDSPTWRGLVPGGCALRWLVIPELLREVAGGKLQQKAARMRSQ